MSEPRLLIVSATGLMHLPRATVTEEDLGKHRGAKCGADGKVEFREAEWVGLWCSVCWLETMNE